MAPVIERTARDRSAGSSEQVAGEISGLPDRRDAVVGDPIQCERECSEYNRPKGRQCIRLRHRHSAKQNNDA